MNEISVVTAVTPINVVRISLTQVNKNNKINASFVFEAQGTDLTDFVAQTAKKVVKVMELQQSIKAKGGKNNAFGLTRSGEFELTIKTINTLNDVKLLNNFVFSLPQLGVENPEGVLIDMVEGFKLLTE